MYSERPAVLPTMYEVDGTIPYTSIKFGKGVGTAAEILMHHCSSIFARLFNQRMEARTSKTATPRRCSMMSSRHAQVHSAASALPYGACFDQQKQHVGVNLLSRCLLPNRRKQAHTTVLHAVHMYFVAFTRTVFQIYLAFTSRA